MSNVVLFQTNPGYLGVVQKLPCHHISRSKFPFFYNTYGEPTISATITTNVIGEMLTSFTWNYTGESEIHGGFYITCFTHLALVFSVYCDCCFDVDAIQEAPRPTNSATASGQPLSQTTSVPQNMDTDHARQGEGATGFSTTTSTTQRAKPARSCGGVARPLGMSTPHLPRIDTQAQIHDRPRKWQNSPVNLVQIITINRFLHILI